MLKPVWFLIKISILVIAVAWLAARPGDVQIEWNGYLIETSFGFLIAVVATLMILTAFVYRIWRGLVRVPVVVRRYRKSQSREKGYQAVTKGLVAVAAGDPKAAAKQARRARVLIPDTALTDLLNAQAALMNGDDYRARMDFENLLEDRDAAFFGLRGLMNDALKKGNHDKALELLRTAEKLHPKREWIIGGLFDAETRAGDWRSAEQTLNKAVKLRVFDRETGNEHHQALLIARAQQALEKGLSQQALSLAKRGFRLGADFLPAAILYARLLLKAGQRRKAVKVIEDAWPKAPHPDLAQLWEQMAPAPKGKTDEDRKLHNLGWYQRLYNLAPYRSESNAMLGRAAMDIGFYEEARKHLKSAGDYRLLAKLERLDGRDEQKAREWLEIAADARPSPRWVCSACGNAAQDWTPLCPSCQSFNSLDWTTPRVSAHSLSVSNNYGPVLLDSGFIEPPQS
jgi:HemY protein